MAKVQKLSEQADRRHPRRDGGEDENPATARPAGQGMEAVHEGP